MDMMDEGMYSYAYPNQCKHGFRIPNSNVGQPWLHCGKCREERDSGKVSDS